MTSAEQQFTEFATLAAPRLRRTAFLLCGDWHTAEDLTQTALAKVFVSWRRISRKARIDALAVTPDGRTVYAVDYRAGTVTPIATATNTAGRPIRVGAGPTALAIAR